MKLVLVAVLVAVAALALGPALKVQAVVITATTTGSESVSGDGSFSLPEAIDNANADADTTGGDCLVGSGADTIELGIELTYLLLQSDNVTDGLNAMPSVFSAITINGMGLPSREMLKRLTSISSTLALAAT